MEIERIFNMEQNSVKKRPPKRKEIEDISARVKAEDAKDKVIPFHLSPQVPENRPDEENIGLAKLKNQNKIINKTPLRPIDRGQIPKTPLKLKAKQMNKCDYSLSERNCLSTKQEERVNSKHFDINPEIELKTKGRNKNKIKLDQEESFQNGCQAEVLYLKLSKNEENFLHIRAEKFVRSIKPDPAYYDIDGGRKIYFMTKMCSKQNYQTNDNSNGKKKRKSYDNMDCYVSHYSRQFDGYMECPLPEGTKLSKPPLKLVELVAKAIFESPDGMLQVQQVYIALQNRYPYFRFMHKNAINSWKSSIRHALYQKWFYKIKISSGLHTDGKGYYWALNNTCTPREWTMPGHMELDEHQSENNVQHEVLKQTVPYSNESECSNKMNLSTTEEKSILQHINGKNKIKLENGTSYPTHHSGLNVTKDPDPLLPSASFRRVKRRLDLSGNDGVGLPTYGTEKDFDMSGITPLSPLQETRNDAAFSISVLPCNFGFWDENQIMFYSSTGTVEYYQPADVHEGQYVWWDGSYYDLFNQYANHDYSITS